jgi:hypothetical protein
MFRCRVSRKFIELVDLVSVLIIDVYSARFSGRVLRKSISDLVIEEVIQSFVLDLRKSASVQ